MSAALEQPRPILEMAIEPETVMAAMSAIMGGTNASQAPGTIAIDPERVEHDLARLVLTLVEFLRRLLELQAIRRMEAGGLSEDEEERVGLTLMRAREKVLELATSFGLAESDLGLDLGPLGKLM